MTQLRFYLLLIILILGAICLGIGEIFDKSPFRNH